MTVRLRTADAVAAAHRHRTCGLMGCFDLGAVLDTWARWAA